MVLTYAGQKGLAYGLIKVSGIEVPGCGCKTYGKMRFPSDSVKELEEDPNGFEVVADAAQTTIRTILDKLIKCPVCGKPVVRG